MDLKTAEKAVAERAEQVLNTSKEVERRVHQLYTAASETEKSARQAAEKLGKSAAHLASVKFLWGFATLLAVGLVLHVVLQH